MKTSLKKGFVSISAGALMLLSFAGVANASGVESKCEVVYGGGQVCETVIKFTLDKKVQKVNKGGEFVDNLGQSDGKFAPGQEVNFKIIVKNTGEETIENLDVADILPKELDFVSGPGNYDNNARTLSYRIGSLEPGKTNENTFTARVVGEGSLPSDKAVVCTTNSARAIASNNSTAEDTSSLCISKGVPTKDTPQVFKTTPVKETPSTGPEALALIGLIPAGATGFYLRRKSVK